MIAYEDTQDGRQVVKITYFGDEEPDVTVIDRKEGSAITVELIDGEEANWFLMEHNGVRIYRTERYAGMGIMSENWVSTRRGCGPDDSDDNYDIREMEAVLPDDKKKYYEDLFPKDWEKQIIAYAIDHGKIEY